MKISRLGAIDIGSNSVKLLISDVIDNNGKITYKASSFTRVPLLLGEDTFSLGYVSEKKIAKLSQLIKTFTSLMQIGDVEDWRICATSALREAANVAEITDYIQNDSGQSIHIISTSEEARLIGLNLEKGEFEDNKIYVVADVGGGCTEITIFEKDQQPIYNSFNLGTIRSLERNEEIAEWKRLEEWLLEGWSSIVKNGYRSLTLMGSGGNINKLNSIFGKRGRIKKHDLNRYYNRIKEMNYDELILNANMGLNRAVVILPAIRIYLHLMKLLKREEIEIPVIGLVDGIIRDLYAKKYPAIQS